MIEELEPVDYLSKSFKSKDLTNQELLRTTYYMMDPSRAGFNQLAISNLNNKAKKYFGHTDKLKFEEIKCDCGKTIATTFKRSNIDWFDKVDNHYMEHKSNAYNEYIESYSEGNKYYVSVYKIFPDLIANNKENTKNFYATYDDAKNKKNILFKASNDKEFSQKLEELDDSKKTKYTYTFTRKEIMSYSTIKVDYILEEYKID